MVSGRLAFGSCGTWAQLLQDMWNLPQPEIKPVPPHWQGDSHPLYHWESAREGFLILIFFLLTPRGCPLSSLHLEAAFTPLTNCYWHLWCARHRACILEQARISPVVLGLTLERVTDRLCAGLSHVRLFVTPWTVNCQVTHEISQARILDWVAISFSRASSCFRD